jgi:hypothetical protein
LARSATVPQRFTDGASLSDSDDGSDDDDENLRQTVDGDEMMSVSRRRRPSAAATATTTTTSSTASTTSDDDDAYERVVAAAAALPRWCTFATGTRRHCRSVRTKKECDMKSSRTRSSCAECHVTLHKECYDLTHPAKPNVKC